MAEESIYDLIVEELKERHRLVKAELHDRFKKTKPFRQEEVSPKEALLEYDELTAEGFERMRQEYGDELVGMYVAKMEKIRRGYKL